jgi:malonate-semialdehyde dehydrogenase (acetylating)/methylmalonate-semialdehyde dehydrogenase
VRPYFFEEIVMSVVSTTTSGTLPLWINGKAVPASSQRTGNITNPATGEVIRKAPLANAADVDAAVKAATAAFPGWRETPPLRRARILTRFRELLEAHRDEFAQLITQEHGKVLADAAGSLQRGIEVVEFASGVPHLLKGEMPRMGKGSIAIRCCNRHARELRRLIFR